MANQPPLRPWSRLASLRSVPPAPAPQSHAPSAPPTFRNASKPPSQQSHQPSEPTAGAGAGARASMPSSPAQNVAAPFAPSLNASPKAKNSSSVDNNNAIATKSQPTTTPAVQRPTQWQNLKQMNQPPSSQALPPPKLNVNPVPGIEPKIPVEEEKKSVLVNNNKTSEKPNFNGNGSQQKGLNKKLSDSEESGMRVITIAGENKGAYMEIIQSRKKPNHLHKMGNSKIKGNGYESEKSGGGEGNANGKKDKSQKVRTLSSPPMNGVYMNSNVQCVNNSLLFHTSCSHNDPGVHLTLSKKPYGEGFHLKEQRN